MMNDTNARAVIGGNNPPDPLEEILARHGDTITEAEGWLDGEPVANEGQMQAVDALAASVKAARKELDEAREKAVKPLHDAWKAEVAHWKPYLDDWERITKGLAAINGDYKKRIAAEQEAAKRKAYAEAEAARIRAEAAQKAADAGSIEAQRQASALKQEALDATKTAQKAGKVKVKGLRKVQRYEIEDHRAALHWIAANDRDAITAFIEEYVDKNHKRTAIDGVRQWEDKEAF
jgi:hypothetical protein